MSDLFEIYSGFSKHEVGVALPKEPPHRYRAVALGAEGGPSYEAFRGRWKEITREEALRQIQADWSGSTATVEFLAFEVDETEALLQDLIPLSEVAGWLRYSGVKFFGRYLTDQEGFVYCSPQPRMYNAEPLEGYFSPAPDEAKAEWLGLEGVLEDWKMSFFQDGRAGHVVLIDDVEALPAAQREVIKVTFDREDEPTSEQLWNMARELAQ